MKPKKKKQQPKTRRKMPDFCDVNLPHIYNLGLAQYGRKVGRRQDAIKLYDRITDWRERLPLNLTKLRESELGYDEATLERFSANEKARIAWCIFVEDAMMRDDAEFFETIAALIKHKVNGRINEHPIEFEVWSQFLRLMRESERLSDDGTNIVGEYPTKGKIKAAAKANGCLVTNWPRMWKRLKLEWLPMERSGPRKGRIR